MQTCGPALCQMPHWGVGSSCFPVLQMRKLRHISLSHMTPSDPGCLLSSCCSFPWISQGRYAAHSEQTAICLGGCLCVDAQNRTSPDSLPWETTHAACRLQCDSRLSIETTHLTSILLGTSSTTGSVPDAQRDRKVMKTQPCLQESYGLLRKIGI